MGKLPAWLSPRPGEALSPHMLVTLLLGPGRRQNWLYAVESQSHPEGGRITALKDTPIPVLDLWIYGLMRYSDFADGIKLRPLRWG